LLPRFLNPDHHWDFIVQRWILLGDGEVVVIAPFTDNGRPPRSRLQHRQVRASVLPVMEARLAELAQDRPRIASSVAIEPAYGHTAGNSILGPAPPAAAA
jgi:hypothetical protein